VPSFLVFGRSFGNTLSFGFVSGSLSSFRVTRSAFGLRRVPNFDRFVAGTLDCLGFTTGDDTGPWTCKSRMSKAGARPR
jgi:hypothetical protein